MYISDLHIHSRFSRATSKEGDPEHLELWARRKGIHILGTGDFTHPAWREELKEKLEPAEQGLYKLKKEYVIREEMCPDNIEPRFVVTGEISSIYKKNGKTRKVHSLLILPGLEEAERVSRKLEAIGNIHSDGRPILGLDCRDLLEIMLDTTPQGIFVPAHIWTPHFAMLGAFSGFDSARECFEDLTPYVHAVETGLSSDPPMNWRVSFLDNFQLISNSDAHSPAKLGREANLMNIELSYEGLEKAIQTGEGLYGTIEFFPEEGKYHYDGHRKCHMCLTPSQTKEYNGKCPVCGRKITIGVEHRVEELADRSEGYRRENARPFENLMPLSEILAEAGGHSASSVKVQKQYQEMLNKLGPEFAILREIPLEDIQKEAGYLVSEGILRLREGRVEKHPGFDGEYGTIKLFRPSELTEVRGQMDFFASLGIAEIESQKPDSALPKAGQSQEEEEVTEDFPQENLVFALNEKQQEAVEDISPVSAVIAGPGTGKTKTLVSKILYLMERRRVKPSEITAVTFTNKAAQEMRERLQKELGSKRSVRNMHIGTFHSICLELLKEQGEEVLLVDESVTQELAKEATVRFSLKISPRKFLNLVSLQKSRDLKEEVSTELREAFDAYENALKEEGVLDFDDLLLRILNLMKSEQGETVRRQNFQYLLVDEFQDVSPVQYRLIQEWSRGGRELFVIGDPDQSIYGFRGSKTGCFTHFCEDYPEAHVIRLEENYRSASQIIDGAISVISQNPGDDRILYSAKGSGSPVRIVEAPTEMSEAVFIAKEINRLVGGMDMLDTENGFASETGNAHRGFGDIGILYRTHYQARLLEKCLRQEGIPYVVAGRDDFLIDAKVRGTVCFFRNILHEEDLLSRKTALKLLWDFEENAITLPVYENLKEKYLSKIKRGKPQKIIENWIKDLELSENEAMEKLAHMAVFYKNMEEFLENLSTGKEGDLMRCGGKVYEADAVKLMTLHASKGLEFPVVFFSGAGEGKIPLERAEVKSDIWEERRLFFVGMTRAREELIFTYTQNPSVFLKDIPQEISVKEKTGKQKAEDSGKQMSLFDFM